MTIDIRELSNPPTRDPLFKTFVGFSWKLYNKKDHPQWVPPLRAAVVDNLDTVKNPFYKRADIQLFLAYREGKPVGRIAAIENRGHNEFHQDKTGFYGFFECINDQEVANRLFDAAANWLRKRGLASMMGPMNPSTNHECGLLVRGQSQHPAVMTTWNPKYFVELHENAGLTKAKDLVAYALVPELAGNLPERVVQFAERFKKEQNYSFRDFDLKNFDREVEVCFEIYNSAWEKNWGFFPMTREEFGHMAKDLKLLVDPDFAFIVEKDGKPAGFMLALPDINYLLKYNRSGRLFPLGLPLLLAGKPFLKAIRIITLGVKKEYRGGGIFALFTYESFLRGKRKKTKMAEASWILEDNEPMNKPWRDLGAPLFRRWRIYQRSLSG